MLNGSRSSISPHSPADSISYPRSFDISMNAADMKLILRDFKEGIKNELTLPMILAILSLWTPLFTSDFKSIHSLSVSSDMLKSGYVIFAALITLKLIYPFFFTLMLHIREFLNFFFPKIFFLKSFDRYVTDPDTKVDQIIEYCNENIIRLPFSIIRASYGTSDKNIFVTDIVRELVSDNMLNISVDSRGYFNRLFTDPIPGEKKYLEIKYISDGREYVKQFSEDVSFTIP